LSHGGIVFSAGAGVKADMQTYRVADAEPDAEPYADLGAEPVTAVGMTGIAAVGVGRLVASPVEDWGAG
jgi:hypothetical protein